MVIEEIGTVKSVEGRIARVSVPRKSACEGCTAGTCRVEDQTMEIEALNQAGAKVGQKVKVAVKPFAYTKGTLVVYGLPAAGLVMGAIIGKEFMSRVFTKADPDMLSAVFGFGFFVISLIGVKVWSHIADKRTDSKPVIEEIL
ncbi:MAG: SoxR reducing system RseC family protein [Nitrospirae bacterium]|nr:SoxR reducing system RseC family protein [Nitrospirota bacterium]